MHLGFLEALVDMGKVVGVSGSGIFRHASLFKVLQMGRMA